MALIEIDGLPNLKMVDLSMAMLNMVSIIGNCLTNIFQPQPVARPLCAAPTAAAACPRTFGISGSQGDARNHGMQLDTWPKISGVYHIATYIIQCEAPKISKLVF